MSKLEMEPPSSEKTDTIKPEAEQIKESRISEDLLENNKIEKERLFVIKENDILGLNEKLQATLESVKNILNKSSIREISENLGTIQFIEELSYEIENGKTLDEVMKNIEKEILITLIKRYRNSKELAKVLKKSGDATRQLLMRNHISIKEVR